MSKLANWSRDRKKKCNKELIHHCVTIMLLYHVLFLLVETLQLKYGSSGPRVIEASQKLYQPPAHLRPFNSKRQ